MISGKKKSLKLEITKIRNSREICVSLKREIIELHDTLGKFSKVKEKLDMILSS